MTSPQASGRPQADTQALSGVTRIERPMVAYVISHTVGTPDLAVNKFTKRYGERAAGQALSAYIAVFIAAVWAMAGIVVMLLPAQILPLELIFFGLCGLFLVLGAWRLISAKRSARS